MVHKKKLVCLHGVENHPANPLSQRDHLYPTLRSSIQWHISKMAKKSVQFHLPHKMRQCQEVGCLKSIHILRNIWRLPKKIGLLSQFSSIYGRIFRLFTPSLGYPFRKPPTLARFPGADTLPLLCRVQRSDLEKSRCAA